MSLVNWAAGYCAYSTALHFSGLGIAGARLRQPHGRPRNADRKDPVTLIRPVCGLDNFECETLASSFAIDYPDYEIIFCVARPDDPAMRTVRGLLEAHPERPAHLLIDDHRFSTNPKLNNLIKGWDAARHRWIVIADSNVFLPPDCIDRLLAAWRPDTGLVCSMPIGARPLTFWAEVECAFLNTMQARYQYVSESLGFGFAQGKTILFRRDIVDGAGGIRALAADDAEDAAATKLVRAAGLRVHLVKRPFEQPLGWRSAPEVWLRQMRWARLRRASFFWLYLPEIFVGSAFPSLAAGIAAAGHGLSIPVSVAVFLLVWFAAELALASAAGWHRSWRLAAALLVRDLLLPALWLGGLLGSQFTWRGNEITAGGDRRSRRVARGAIARIARAITG